MGSMVKPGLVLDTRMALTLPGLDLNGRATGRPYQSLPVFASQSMAKRRLEPDQYGLNNLLNDDPLKLRQTFFATQV